MLRLSRTLLSAFVATATLTGAAGAASAHMAGGHPHFGHHGGHFHDRHGRVFIGLGGWDDGYGYGGGGCSYLHFKAEQTGRPYWWHRYHECIDG